MIADLGASACRTDAFLELVDSVVVNDETCLVPCVRRRACRPIECHRSWLGAGTRLQIFVDCVTRLESSALVPDYHANELRRHFPGHCRFR